MGLLSRVCAFTEQFDTTQPYDDNGRVVRSMRIGAFQLVGALPELREPHVLAMLRPWIDAGNVGALALLELESQFGSEQIASLARPGLFYDFTRYRPTVYIRDGNRDLSIPNTVVSVVRPPGGRDLVIIKMLEPHMFAEAYVESVLSLLETIGARRYFWIGSMYDMVPHTRPLLVSGGAFGSRAEEEIRRLKVLPTEYQGPSTLMFQIVQQAPLRGIESMWCIVHLPQYVQMEEDYAGKVRLLQVLQSLYGVHIAESDVEMALEQNEAIDIAMQDNPDLAAVVPHFVARYEARLHHRESEVAPLPPDVQQFLRDLDSQHGTD